MLQFLKAFSVSFNCAATHVPFFYNLVMQIVINRIECLKMDSQMFIKTYISKPHESSAKNWVMGIDEHQRKWTHLLFCSSDLFSPHRQGGIDLNCIEALWVMWVYPFILHYLNKYLGGSKSTPLVYPGVSPALEGEGGFCCFFSKCEWWGAFKVWQGINIMRLWKQPPRAEAYVKIILVKVEKCWEYVGVSNHGQGEGRAKGQRAKGRGTCGEGGKWKPFQKQLYSPCDIILLPL